MRLKAGCGCYSLKSVSIVLAAVSIGTAISSIILLSCEMNEIRERGLSVAPGQIEWIWFLFIGAVIYIVINGCTAGLMIYGSVRKNPDYVFPFIALGLSPVIINVALCISAGITFSAFLTISQFFMGTAFVVLPTAVQFYFWLILYSHYQELVAEKYGCQPLPEKSKIYSQPINPYHNV